MTRTTPRGAELRAESPPEAPAVLTVDLAALRENYRKIKSLSSNASCAAVVKADAYGIGVGQVVPALIAEGCDTFFIATPDEAREVREIAPAAQLYALDGLLPRTTPLFAELDLRPVLGGIDEVEDWAAFATTQSEPPRAALHIDTGMNRLGLRAAEIADLVADPALIGAFDLTLVMSHLACSDEPDNPKNEAQRETFDRLRAMLPPAPASLANSGGVFLGSDFHYDMVRPGIALYGGRATAAAGAEMTPVAHLAGRILQVKHAEPDETVGYGATWKLTRRTRLAIVAAGYADGYFRALSSSGGHARAKVYLDEHEAPVLGRVSMDLIAVDVTDVPDELAKRGAFVELLGGRVGIDDLAQTAGTIGYEVLTRLGRRYYRQYQDG